MTIFDWHKCLPKAKAFDGDGIELSGRSIFRIDTETGNYEYHKRGRNGEFYVFGDDVASGLGWAKPPIRIVWSRNRLLYRWSMWWTVFTFKILVWRRTGQWPHRVGNR